jgi:glyoxylase-like metal-dependent hydrolase (beta-lactamase superfamily II)
MLRRILVAFVALIAVGVVFVAVGLVLAKRAIVALEPPLPSAREIVAFDAAADLPVRISWHNTARQRMPRSGVLEPSLDPTPDAPYVMSHPAFALEWADGRIFLIDAGMDREAALAFGRPIEALSGGDPLEPLASAAEKLGDALARVQAIAFTHEHTDHTEGVAELCRLRGGGALRLVQGRLQVAESNYTTRGAQAQLEQAGCLKRELVEGGPMFAIDGFPGLAFFAAAGHTPGSQVFVAHVRGADGVKTFVFTGDVVNQIDGARRNLPKPRLYSLLVVPEHTERLERLRRLLGELEREHGATLLVSHDQLALEASGVPGG